MVKKLSKLVHALLIWSMIWSGYSTVLCYGSDGHMEIESIVHNHCDHDESDHTNNELLNTELSNSCNPCEDFPVSNDFEPVRIKKPIQHNVLTLSVSYSAAINSVYKICLNESDISTFFIPLKSIRLLT